MMTPEDWKGMSDYEKRFLREVRPDQVALLEAGKMGFAPDGYVEPASTAPAALDGWEAAWARLDGKLTAGPTGFGGDRVTAEALASWDQAFDAAAATRAAAEGGGRR